MDIFSRPRPQQPALSTLTQPRTARSRSQNPDEPSADSPIDVTRASATATNLPRASSAAPAPGRGGRRTTDAPAAGSTVGGEAVQRQPLEHGVTRRATAAASRSSRLTRAARGQRLADLDLIVAESGRPLPALALPVPATLALPAPPAPSPAAAPPARPPAPALTVDTTDEEDGGLALSDVEEEELNDGDVVEVDPPGTGKMMSARCFLTRRGGSGIFCAFCIVLAHIQAVASSRGVEKEKQVRC